MYTLVIHCELYLVTAFCLTLKYHTFITPVLQSPCQCAEYWAFVSLLDTVRAALTHHNTSRFLHPSPLLRHPGKAERCLKGSGHAHFDGRKQNTGMCGEQASGKVEITYLYLFVLFWLFRKKVKKDKKRKVTLSNYFVSHSHKYTCHHNIKTEHIGKCHDKHSWEMQ